MAGWRKRNGADAWHNCSNCSNYPTSNYTTSASNPTSGEKCNECLAKVKAGTCS